MLEFRAVVEFEPINAQSTYPHPWTYTSIDPMISEVAAATWIAFVKEIHPNDRMVKYTIEVRESATEWKAL